MFFIDLEPDINNPDIFNLSLLCYSKIKVEAPRPKKDTPQCLRCQSYGHTHPDMFAAVIPMTHHNAKKIELNPPNVPYAVAHILPTTKVFQCTKNSAKIKNTYHGIPGTKTHRTTKHFPPHKNLIKTPTWNSLPCHNSFTQNTSRISYP